MSNTSGFVGVFDANERLQINVLGKFSAAFRGKALRLGRKAQAMLAYISLGGDSEATRERLAGLLWSESDEQLARGSLRHALHELQREIRNVAFPHLTSDKLTIGIDKRWIATDLGAVLERAESGSVHSLLTERRRITDTLLQDLDGIDPAFNTWLRELRTHAHARLLAALERLLPKENNGEVSEAAESIARAITMLDPAHEASTRLMIRTRWAAGDTGRALAIYTELWQYLDREFDTKPSIETQDLIARLRMEESDEAVTPESLMKNFASPTSGYDARPSIAVLPFRTIGPAEEEYFGEGVVDNIIQSLAGLRDLFVISRGSTAQYKQASPDFRAIGRELGVRYVLTGKAQRGGEALRITTELVETESAEVLKPRRYEGKLADLFKLQDEIALETTKFIAPYVRERELKRAMKKHPESMTAYDLVLQALGPMYELDYSSFSRARGLLDRAMSVDPNFGPARSYAAYWHILRVAQEWSTDIPADILAASSFAEAAMVVDRNDPLSLAIFGYMQAFLKKNYRVALDTLDRSISVSPNLAIGWIFKAATHTFVGPTCEAVNAAMLGVKLSPRDQHLAISEHILSQAYYVDDKFDQAIEWSLKCHSKNDKLSANLRILISALVAAGRASEAREFADWYRKLLPTFSVKAWEARTPLEAEARTLMANRMRSAGLGY